tara:strand:- start:1984 stop:2442 length:459 start_codon:yes stop_codon:yes gene_type:complete
MNNLLIKIQLVVESENIPLLESKSRPIFNKLINGVKRKDLRAINESYHGSPLEDLEGEKYGYWLIDRYEDSDGDRCLILNNRHLSGDKKLDMEARRIRRKQRAELSLKKAKQGEKFIPKALAELNQAQMNYLLLLGDAANDPDININAPTED